MSVGYMERWNTKQYIPVHTVVKGMGLCKCSEIAKDHPIQSPGDKDSFSLQRPFFAEV